MYTDASAFYISIEALMNHVGGGGLYSRRSFRHGNDFSPPGERERELQAGNRVNEYLCAKFEGNFCLIVDFQIYC